MNSGRLGVNELPDPGRRGVAEDGSGTGVEKCCSEPPVERDCGMANGENLAMKAVKPAGRQPPEDHRVTETPIPQLLTAHDAVLLSREPDD